MYDDVPHTEQLPSPGDPTPRVPPPLALLETPRSICPPSLPWRPHALCARPSLPPLAATDLSTVSEAPPFPDCHIVGTTQYVAFSNWLLSPSNMHVSFLLSFHGPITFFFTAAPRPPNILLSDVPVVSHSPTKGHLGCFRV